ncbi:ras di-ras and rheb family members of small gtpase superfamily [Anaeramoeba ignava]|uniref:Ras di-ras and rheb family members of small gtpase superfamily n=1 Tax=Anaeramoeba ignava TaxID=1746090 RepID=A0A9Q0LQD6_ANAIG|nr:ras di-ras and rheb family members of small gtpase superfamily [Anaeramoeba ignava]
METDGKKIRISIFGTEGTGRQSIALRFCNNAFLEVPNRMNTSSFQKKTVFQDRTIFFEIIVYSKDHYGSDFPIYYAPSSDCVFFIYSIESEKSFEEIASICGTFQNSIKDMEKFELIPKILVANKKDLENERKIPFKQGQDLAYQYGMHFTEVSTKTNENIDSLFEKAALEVLRTNNYLFEFLRTFQQEMIQFLERKELSDFSFEFDSQNEEPIPLHSLILKYRIGNDFEAKLEKLKNQEKKDVVQFLSLIYSGLERYNNSKIQELSKETGIEIKIGREKLIEDMKKLYLDQESKDFSIMIQEKEIKVHKIILALRSEVYREMFNKVLDDSGKVKDYTNSKFKTFQTLIQFFYTDTIEENISLETIQELKNAEDFYQLNSKSSLQPQLEHFESKKKGKSCLIF